MRLQANMQLSQPMQRSGWATLSRRRDFGFAGVASASFISSATWLSSI